MLIFTKNYEIFHSKAFIMLLMIVSFLTLNTLKLNSNEENKLIQIFENEFPINILEMFEGNWLNNDTLQSKINEYHKIDITYESWKRIDKFTLIGNSCKVRSTISKKNDTIFTEQLKIQVEVDSIVYYAKTSQNKDTIRFVCKEVTYMQNTSKSEAKKIYSFTFINIGHDFPNVIQYNFINDSLINVELKDNKGKGFGLLFKKVK